MSAAAKLLRSSRVEVAPETYALVSLTQNDWQQLLEKPELSPRMSAPFMILWDRREVTLLLDDVDLETVRHAVRNAKIERGFRLLTFDIELDFAVLGFVMEVSSILAGAGIAIIPVSAFSRDHLLIKQDRLADALKALGPHVNELC